MRMKSLVVVLLLVGACAQPAESDAVAEPTATTQGVGSTSSTPPTAGESSATTTAPASETSRPAPNPDRTLAPEFSLTLSDGSVYEYANELRPVYLVFWAEW
jgi:hypothetical protein